MTTLTCPICRSSFAFGDHQYDGKYLPYYGLTVCWTCYRANHDGWGPFADPFIVEALSSAGRTHPPRNEKGWLPRDYREGTSTK